ncbi:MAG: sigma-70 family RNA polymerase sigma factor [Ignavibacteriales bacterium]|jgi:RNA polymerase sigma factor for flagellar operon FliA|nr:sigma-70 family RNA polymerase sigma factor [Melioribacteraceae bacterium]RJP63124.1 MAG: sigma-70 family RNA polymerase sigma factor [Ignavibacteriales bacterium]
MSNTDLWSEYKKSPNFELKKEIVITYSNLVHYVIHNSKFINYDIFDEKDYFQFGIEGLSEAIDRFDPDYGTKFETYALQRIRGKIIDEIRKVQSKYRVQTNSNILATNLSLNKSVSDDESFMLYEVIPDDNEEPDETLENLEAKELLVEALQKLEERDRLIITLYYYEHLNYKEIAQILGITVSRVSQVHSKIIDKLRSKLAHLND